MERVFEPMANELTVRWSTQMSVLKSQSLSRLVISLTIRCAGEFLCIVDWINVDFPQVSLFCLTEDHDEVIV